MEDKTLLAFMEQSGYNRNMDRFEQYVTIEVNKTLLKEPIRYGGLVYKSVVSKSIKFSINKYEIIVKEQEVNIKWNY